jgi:hypothetical protein
MARVTSSGFTVHLSGGCWPTPGQTLLLRAALLSGPEAVPAWRKWNESHELDHLEAGTFRLLGLLYRNLVRAGVDANEALMPRLKGIYRNFWTKNQLILGRKVELLRTLESKGIPMMLLKGAALTLTVYRDHGVRPMDDFDLMVPRDRVSEAMDVLEALGWQSEVHAPRDLPSSIHACSFRNAEGACIDLHWCLCHLPAGAEFDRSLWEQSELLVFQGVNLVVPSATDQFLHTCAHGPQYKAVSPVRWIADACCLLKQSGSKVDWDRIATYAPAVGAVLGVQGTLIYLSNHLELPVPEPAERTIFRLRPTFQERWETRLLGKRLPSPLHRMPLDFSHHLRCSRGQGLIRRLRGFPQYFRHANNLEHGQFTAHHRARAVYWLRHWLPWHLRRVPRLFRAEEAGSVRMMSPGRLRGFYDLEPCGARSLRWSRPDAGITFALPRSRNIRLTIDTGRLRAWASDLSRHLRFRFQGAAVAPEWVKGKQGVLTIRLSLPKEQDRSNGFGILDWTCDPMACPGDSRALGLPVLAFSVQVIKIKAPPAAPEELTEGGGRSHAGLKERQPCDT